MSIKTYEMEQFYSFKIDLKTKFYQTDSLEKNESVIKLSKIQINKKEKDVNIKNDI